MRRVVFIPEHLAALVLKDHLADISMFKTISEHSFNSMLSRIHEHQICIRIREVMYVIQREKKAVRKVQL